MKNFILYFRFIVYSIISESPYIQKGTGKVNVKYGKNEHTASRCIISNYPNLKHLIDNLPTFFGKFFTILVSSSSVSFLLMFSFSWHNSSFTISYFSSIFSLHQRRFERQCYSWYSQHWEITARFFNRIERYPIIDILKRFVRQLRLVSNIRQLAFGTGGGTTSS